jgi:uncharacterized membrane protein (UPF0127 family)
MSNYRILRNQVSGQVILPRARWCASFWCHLKGLMFRANLPTDEGLLFVTRSESVVNTTIHMFFMRFAIGVVWLDARGVVVHKTLAKPWRPAYAPSRPAQYYLEANPHVLEHVQVGDVLTFDEPAAHQHAD